MRTTRNWSPDGRMVAFASDRDSGNLDVFVAEAAGGGSTARKLIASPGLDGRRLVYIYDPVPGG